MKFARRHPVTAPRLMVVGAALAATACSASTLGSAGHGTATNQASGGVTTPAPTDAPLTLKVSPSDQSRSVPLNSTVTVTSNGSLDYVSVAPRNDGAAPLAGTMDSLSHTWTSAGALVPATTYVVKASAHNGSGQSTTQATFATVNALRLTTTPTPTDGATVGVGMPIKLVFNTPVDADKQANLVNHINVVTTPPVTGAWHWFSPSEVHWRPADTWPAGTKVTVQANLAGVEAGGGYWGLANWSESFAIGDKHVSYIDNNTHMMTVTSNGQTVWTWPVSLGTPSRPTISGTLVIWYHQYDVLMDSLSLSPPIPHNAPGGYYDHVYWDTAISTDGFFIHAAPWSVYAQGNSNVSHGCVNLSTDRATTFYNWSLVGDVVVIINTGRWADASDGEGDWQIPFPQYANSQGGVTTDTTQPVSPGGI